MALSDVMLVFIRMWRLLRRDQNRAPTNSNSGRILSLDLVYGSFGDASGRCDSVDPDRLEEEGWTVDSCHETIGAEDPRFDLLLTQLSVRCYLQDGGKCSVKNF